MPSREIVWEIPERLYGELIWAQKELAYPNIIALVSQAVQRYLSDIKHDSWIRDFHELQRLVRASGGFDLGETKEEVIDKLREQRRQIFEEDYAHLYR